MTASASGRGFLMLGDDKGFVYILNKSLAILVSFKAHHSRVTHMKQAKHKGILLTIGDDDTATPTLKAWVVEKDVLDTGKVPPMLYSKKIVHKAKTFPITAIALLENLSQVAIGLENGVVLTYRGDLSRARQTKTVVVHEGSETVTGLGYREEGNAVVLYIVTLSRILTCHTSKADVENVLEEQGTEIGLSSITPQDNAQEMAMARDEAIYFYGPDGRGPCFIMEGEKSLLNWFRGYVVTVSKESPLKTNVLSEFGQASETTASPELSRSWPSGSPSPGNVLTIYDLKSKFIAFRGSFGTRRFDSSVGTAVGEAIVQVVSEWGDLFVVTKEKKIFRLREIDLDSKLEILYAKNWYNLAVSILINPPTALYNASGAGQLVSSPSGADLSNSDDSTNVIIMDVYKRYADYLYTRGEFDASMKNYIRTIGHLEPSYIIRKFLDAQRIYSLTSYLQALHERQLANSNHTTLLLNCYTKLKDTTRLDAFINTDAHFDTESAIRVCRQAGYFEHALKLALRFQQHELYLKVLIESLQEYDKAVAYLTNLPRSQILSVIPNYGYELVQNRPKQTTEILVQICIKRPQTHQSTPTKSDAVVSTPKSELEVPSDNIGQPEEYLPYFVNQPTWCISFLEQVLQNWQLHGYGLPNEDDVIEPPEVTSSQIMCDSLLELYLNQLYPQDEDKKLQASLKPASQKTIDKIMKLLEAPKSNYDSDQALVLCKIHQFRLGILYLYQKLGLYNDLLEFYMERQEYNNVLQSCQSFGDKQPLLWTKALVFFVEKGVRDSTESLNKLPTQPNKDLVQVLEQIDKRRLLSLLQVVQLLSKNPSVTLGIVKDYLVEKMSQDIKSIEEVSTIVHGP